MAEQVRFVESFDHLGDSADGFVGAKYGHVRGAFSLVPGPYHGNAARFAGVGNELGPAGWTTTHWGVGAFSASLYVESTGWAGGEVALLAPCYWDGTNDFPNHWLTVDEDGTLRARSWVGPPFPPGGPPNTVVLTESAAGAVPFDQWCRLEYRTRIGRSEFTGLGSAEARIDGVDVLSATGIDTTDETRATYRAEYFRFGHLAKYPQDGGLDGIGVPAGAEAVGVAFDDVCQRVQSTATPTATMLPFRDDAAVPHRVVCLFPTGAGLHAELALTGAGANWAACAEAPPDGDTSYVEKTTLDPEALALPVDLYAITPAPTIAVSTVGRYLHVLGLCRSVDATPRAAVRYRPGGGVETPSRQTVGATYRYIGTRDSFSPTFVTNTHLTGFQIGWGWDDVDATTLAETYRGTQVVAELWYRPDVVPAAGRTWATWLGT